MQAHPRGPLPARRARTPHPARSCAAEGETCAPEGTPECCPNQGLTCFEKPQPQRKLFMQQAEYTCQK